MSALRRRTTTPKTDPPAPPPDPRALAAETALASIPRRRLAAALTSTDPTATADSAPRKVQTRVGEEWAAIGGFTQLLAVVESPWFWKLVALFPGNDVGQKGRGRPQHYPDWLLFLLSGCVSGITNVCSRRAAVAMFYDHYLWALFVAHVDPCVPPGMTKIGELTGPKPRSDRIKARPLTPPQPTSARALRDRPGPPAAVLPVPPVPPPSGHHLDHFIAKWRGFDKTGKRAQPLPPGHPFHGLRQRIFDQFEALGVEQAQDMGLLNPTLNFDYRNPAASQFVGFDGTVMPVSRRHRGDTTHKWKTGDDRTLEGSKYTIASIRVIGEAWSRVHLAFAQTGRSRDSVYPSEERAIVDMALRLRDLSGGGMKGIVVDSVLRGRDVTHLQQQSVTVVNYPYAKENPNGGKGKRLNDTRVEKSHLRRLFTHYDEHGAPCEHSIFALGGQLVLLVETDEGYDVAPMPVVKYEQRDNRDGTRREYVTVRIDCDIAGADTHRIPLFHGRDPRLVEGMKTDADPDFNWGEVVRVFPPGTRQFNDLYGARNDTEARHADLKSRIKYLPPDVAAQDLRMLGAMITANAVAWQAHLQARRQPNILDRPA